jgi:hypothetical protein
MIPACTCRGLLALLVFAFHTVRIIIGASESERESLAVADANLDHGGALVVAPALI